MLLALAFEKLDASAIICSVKYDNGPQQWRLEKLGWDHISNALWIMRRDYEEEKSSTLYNFDCPLHDTGGC